MEDERSALLSCILNPESRPFAGETPAETAVTAAPLTA